MAETPRTLAELLREAANHANRVSSIASSDPWWVIAAAWLEARGVRVGVPEPSAAAVNAVFYESIGIVFGRNEFPSSGFSQADARRLLKAAYAAQFGEGT